jgi:methylated-DNA-[protein]-cysteine S-methyltransferase
MSEQLLFQESFATPTGPMLLLTDVEHHVRALDWVDKESRMLALLQRYYRGASLRVKEQAQPTAARRALLAYFEGEKNAIDTLPVATTGTDFQRTVWRALREIPLGEVISYSMLAQRIGRPNACRAVGLANGANPISIIVPCHRVIGANAALTGYGGGVERKRWLLAHEGVSVGAVIKGPPLQMAMAIDE